MIETIFTPKPTADNLTKKSDSILSVFRKTIAELEEVNVIAREQKDKKIAEMELARKEIAELELLHLDNQRISEKLSNILK